MMLRSLSSIPPPPKYDKYAIYLHFYIEISIPSLLSDMVNIFILFFLEKLLTEGFLFEV